MRLVTICALLISASAPLAAIAQDVSVAQRSSAVRLEAGRTIPLIIQQRLSTNANAKGDLIAMTVAQDVRVGDRLVLPAGAKAVGEITRCDPKGAFGKAGRIEARALYVELVGGRIVRITGALASRGQTQTTETVLTAIAFGTLAFAVTGKSAVIESGSLVDAVLDRTVEVEVD